MWPCPSSPHAPPLLGRGSPGAWEPGRGHMSWRCGRPGSDSSPDSFCMALGLHAPHASHRRRQCVGCSGTETPCHQGTEPAHGPSSRFNLYAGSRVCPPVGRGAHRRRGGGLPCPRPAHSLSAGQGFTQTALHPPGPHTLQLAAPAMRALETALVLSALLLLPAEAQNGRAPPSGAVGWRDGLSTSPFSMRT